MGKRAATAWKLVRTGEPVALARALLPRGVFFHSTKLILRATSILPLIRPLDRARIRWAGPEDEPILQRFRPRGEIYRQRFAAGLRCILGEIGDEPASLHWLDLGERHESKPNAFRFRMIPRSCWCFEMRVAPRYRATGLFHKHWAESMRLLEEIGVDTWYATVEERNRRAVSSFVSLGAQVLYRLRVSRVAGIVRYTVWDGDGGATPPSARGFGTWSGADPDLGGPPATAS